MSVRDYIDLEPCSFFKNPSIRKCLLRTVSSVTAGSLTLSSPLTGYTVGTNTPITASDTILEAFGNIQGQLNAIEGSSNTPNLLIAATNSTGSIVDGTANVITRPLTGFVTGANTAILATDTILGALQKTQGQVNSRITLTSAITGYTVGANTALAATDTLLASLGKIQGQINARTSLSSPLTGLSIPGGVSTPITASDTIIGAFGKVQGSLNNKIEFSSPLTGYIQAGSFTPIVATDTMMVALEKLGAYTATGLNYANPMPANFSPVNVPVTGSTTLGDAMSQFQGQINALSTQGFITNQITTPGVQTADIAITGYMNAGNIKLSGETLTNTSSYLMDLSATLGTVVNTAINVDLSGSPVGDTKFMSFNTDNGEHVYIAFNGDIGSRGSIHVGGSCVYKLFYAALTTDTLLDNVDSNSLISNDGATQNVLVTLPIPVPGACFKFVKIATGFTFNVQADPTSKFIMDGSTTALGATITSQPADTGTYLYIVGININTWVVLYKSTQWTF